jgi:hypothetical protein
LRKVLPTSLNVATAMDGDDSIMLSSRSSDTLSDPFAYIIIFVNLCMHTKTK